MTDWTGFWIACSIAFAAWCWANGQISRLETDTEEEEVE